MLRKTHLLSANLWQSILFSMISLDSSLLTISIGSLLFWLFFDPMINLMDLVETPVAKLYSSHQPRIVTLQSRCQNQYNLKEKYPTKALSLNSQILLLNLILERPDVLFENHTCENSWSLFDLKLSLTQIQFMRLPSKRQILGWWLLPSHYCRSLKSQTLKSVAIWNFLIITTSKVWTLDVVFLGKTTT